MASPQTLARQTVRRQSRQTLLQNGIQLNNQTTKTRQGSDSSSSSSSSSSSKSSFAWMKHGIGRLTATVDDNGRSKLTQVSHKAPMRWLPLQSSKVVDQAGAAVAAMSNYGAGLLPGDINQVHLHCREKARLAVLTQGSNRIYKQQPPKQQLVHSNDPIHLLSAKSTLQATVDEGGFLVVAPDPTVPFAQSAFHQQQHFTVHPKSSLISVDWFSAGRIANGERWMATRVSSETKLSLQLVQETENLDDADADTQLLVWDGTTLDRRATHKRNYHGDNPFGFDLGQESFNAYASILLYGEESLAVVEQLRALEYQFAEPHTHTRLRLRPYKHPRMHPKGADNPSVSSVEEEEEDSVQLVGTTGRILLGVSELEMTTPIKLHRHHHHHQVGPAYMARLVASSNEDLYRALHHAFKPLASTFGLEFYQDRIRSASSGPAPTATTCRITSSTGAMSGQLLSSSTDEISDQTDDKENVASSKNSPKATMSWKAFMLADSALPTGAFAHSSGLEAASQLGLLVPEEYNEQRTTINGANNDNQNDIHNSRNVQMFIEASTRSTLQQASPWIMTGHDIGTRCFSADDMSSNLQVVTLLEEWQQLDHLVHAVMVCSAPACRASLDQGRNLLRVAVPWLQRDLATVSSRSSALALTQAVQEYIAKTNVTTAGHLAPLFGILGGALELDAEETCHLFGYCVARDLVSAAVRLNLIGPLASVGMLSQAQEAAQEGVYANRLIQENCEGLLWSSPLLGSCAPVVDALHPCHDLLAVRLFRS